MEPCEAIPLEAQLNDDLVAWCATGDGRFSGFGVPPLGDVDECVRELARISKLELIRGVIMSTKGFGKNLDNPALDPIWEMAEGL